IFAQLGMKDSGYDSNSAVISHRASGYLFRKSGSIRMQDRGRELPQVAIKRVPSFRCRTGRLHRQQHTKHAALAWLAFHRDLSAMPVDDLGNDRQSQSDALRLGSKERIEDGLELRRVDA